MKTPLRLVLLVAVVWFTGLSAQHVGIHKVLAQEAPPLTTGPSVEDQLRGALAVKTRALGACNQELGQLQGLQAQVMEGTLRDVGQVVGQIKAQFEKKNPGKTFDADFAIVNLPAKQADPKGRGGS